ncbi:MAG: FAD-dependent oxidoreductase, partial [Anaerolineales bacterium]|nr:FAD-dependent oxidoreductase [Anaerolineales bacterium]
MSIRELKTELLIVGGGLGGVAAALAALRLGREVILSEETPWLGGQMTAQAVPPDEHPWIEETGCTRSYRALREGIRDYYRRFYPMIQEVKA